MTGSISPRRLSAEVVESMSGSFTVRRIVMSKKKQQSVLQQKAADLRELKESIDKFKVIKDSLQQDVDILEAHLMEARANLRDTKIFLEAQQKKLNADANDMHNLIERAMDGY
jgi:hypothetical protein